TTRLPRSPWPQGRPVRRSITSTIARSSARCAPSRSSQALPRSGSASRPELTIRYCSEGWSPASVRLRWRVGGAATGRGAVGVRVLPGREDERRAPAGAGGRAEPHAGRERGTAVVTEGWVLLLAPAELRLQRRRDERQVVEPAHVGATESGSLELPAEERHRDRPHAVDLAGEAFRLQPAELVRRHRLDRGVVVAALAHRFTSASAEAGGPAVSGTSPSGTSATSIWISTVALRRSASVRRSASASAGGRAGPARKVARP